MDPKAQTPESKKIPLEELPHDELLKKCKSYLTIAQKAKQAKDALAEELHQYQSKVGASEELIEALTSQKLQLVTELEKLKQEHKAFQNRSEELLGLSEAKATELDTENVSYRRQVNRLTDENEQLITHLDELERQIEELKRVGLEQQQELLKLEKFNVELLEKNNSAQDVEELQKMLTVSLEEVQKIKATNASLEDQIVILKQQLQNIPDETQLKLENEELKVQLSSKLITSDSSQLSELNDKLLQLQLENDTLHKRLVESEETTKICQEQLAVCKTELEKYTANADDLNTEIHKGRALIEKLNLDIANMSHRLNDNQIVSSGLTTDLQNTNEKMRERLKLYHGKIVRFAGDIKRLKEIKSMLLENFKVYNEQVEHWRLQLIVAVDKLRSEMDIRDQQYKALERSLCETETENKTNNKLILELRNAIAALESDLQEARESGDAQNEKYREENLKLTLDNEQLLKTIDELRFKSNVNDEGDAVVSLKRENVELLAEMNEMNQALKERWETINKQQVFADELLKKCTSLEKQVVDLQQEITDLRKGDEDDTLSTSTISRTEEANRLKELEGSWEERYVKLRNLALKLKAKIKELTAELSEKTMKFQAQLDSKQDEIDKLTEENRHVARISSENSKLKATLSNYEDTHAKLLQEMENLTKEKNSVDDFKKQVSSKVQSLKKELEANAMVKKEFESRIAKLKADLEQKERSLKEERDKHEITKNTIKRQSVLSLEIADYEKSIKELTTKLEKKNEVINKLKNQIDGNKSTSTLLKEQAKMQEEKCKNLEDELEAARYEISTLKKTVTDLESAFSEKEAELFAFRRDYENVRAENEDITTQLSKSLSEQEKNIDSLKKEKEVLLARRSFLEQKLRELEGSLSLKDTELDNVKGEYEGYKIRAQSVLRQNQSRDVVAEEKLKEENTELKREIGELKKDIDEIRINLHTLTIECTKLQTEKESLLVEKLEICGERDEFRKEIEKLNEKYHQSVAEHIETVRSLKLNTETLSQCYRQQLSEQEARHNREIIELQSKIDKNSSAADVPSLTIPTTPREEGEGSEYVDNGNYGNSFQHPLEKILSNNDDDTIDAMTLRKLHSEDEAKIAHLTALLADTEQDLAKHVQMNKVLKEEIRRQQRSVEREKHAENLEYMKNVVFKFITLGHGDERLRLVPVLNTILKLSPEETQKLNSVARGEKSTWSNYLPGIWPNAPK